MQPNPHNPNLPKPSGFGSGNTVNELFYVPVQTYLEQLETEWELLSETSQMFSLENSVKPSACLEILVKLDTVHMPTKELSKLCIHPIVLPERANPYRYDLLTGLSRMDGTFSLLERLLLQFYPICLNTTPQKIQQQRSIEKKLIEINRLYNDVSHTGKQLLATRPGPPPPSPEKKPTSTRKAYPQTYPPRVHHMTRGRRAA